MLWDYERCVALFYKEIALVKRLFLVEESVRQAVMAREWTDFDWKMAEISQIGEEFAVLEAERIELIAGLKGENKRNNSEFVSDSEPSFYSMIAKLPSEEYRELSNLYRELKTETVKVKVLNETFIGYINEVRTMAAAWLDAVFPAQGKLYTRKGRQVSRDLRSMILNHSI